MEISIKSVKKMLEVELEGHYRNSDSVLTNMGHVPDAQREMLRVGREMIMGRLEMATTWEELDELVSFAGYRMSLQQWLDSY